MEDNKFNMESQSAYTPQKPKKKKEKRFSLSTVIVSVALAVVIGALSGGIVAATIGTLGYFKLSNSNSQAAEGTNNGTVNINVENVDENLAVAVAQKVTPSVVGIRTTTKIANFFGGVEESSGEGSGVIYKSDGYIITNYHVISDAIDYGTNAKILVYIGNDTENGYNASVVGYNISCDLAVIKISGKNLPAIDWGDSSELKVGQTVVAIGNPGGLEFMGSVTMGIVSGLNRVVSDAYDSSAVQLIQTDAAINPGNSGGALVNEEGALVGINSSKIVSEGFEGMGFAIPSNTVKDICDKIISKEFNPSPYIGVTVSERYTPEVLSSLGLPSGAVVYSVVSGGPANNAGIKQGDIITEFNGEKITDYSKLYDAITKCKPGEKVNFTIYRSRRYHSGTVTIGSNNSQ
ncbi:MAG: PDZ domain-containing protein [Ruminococcaceae bacterium]|nr:PDZ domain-containing protein [Oscillospiraceae bacterium]